MSQNINNKWNPHSSTYEPLDGMVHIWYVPLNTDAATQIKYWKILSDDERSRANRFRFTSDKIKYVSCRGALRSLLGRYLMMAPESVEITYIKNGKPNHDSNLEFNVSHSENWGVIGFTLDTILGVDIEYTNRIIEFEEIADRFFSQKESADVINAEKDQLPLCFYNCWTRKEAFIKALGDGLSFPLDQFEVSCRPDATPQLIKTHWDYSEADKWSLWAFEKGSDYVGAIALKGPKKNVAYYNWNHTDT